MIISASRRTDVPAFYSAWFMNRVREEFCLVPNPFNAKQISRLSLASEDVDAVVFWTKDFRPMLEHVGELEERKIRFYVQYTVTGYDRTLENHVPELEQRIDTFRATSQRLAPWRVVWRYDPLVSSNRTDVPFHRETFRRLANALQGHTERVVVSVVDIYKKTERQFRALEKEGFHFQREPLENAGFRQLLRELTDIATQHGMEIYSCAEPKPLAELGIAPGRCIDSELIQRLGGIATIKKDKGQRAACLCHQSRDIGVVDTCLHGCRYCYSTRSHELAMRRYQEHDPTSSMLQGKVPDDLAACISQPPTLPKQTKLF